MSQRAINWGTLIAGLALAGGLAVYVAQSTAAAEVRPVENRVTKLETYREEDVQKIDEMRRDIKELLRRLP